MNFVRNSFNHLPGNSFGNFLLCTRLLLWLLLRLFFWEFLERFLFIFNQHFFEIPSAMFSSIPLRFFLASFMKLSSKISTNHFFRQLVCLLALDNFSAVFFNANACVYFLETPVETFSASLLRIVLVIIVEILNISSETLSAFLQQFFFFQKLLWILFLLIFWGYI